MSNSPRVPINLRQDAEKVSKAATLDETSYRSGIRHKPEYRNQYLDDSITQRNMGCTILRRYPNGQLCFEHVCNEILSLINKVKDGGHVTDYEKAVLALCLPQPFSKLMDSKIAQTMTKLSKEERMLIAHMVGAKLREIENYNAGRGGGSIDGRSSTRS